MVRRAAMSSCARRTSLMRVGGAQLRAQLAARGAGEQVAQRLLRHLAALEAVVEPEADHRPAGLEQGGVGHAHLLARGVAVGHQAAERRQRLRGSARTLRPPAVSSTTSTGSPPLASISAAVRSSASGSTAASAPSSSARSRRSGEPAVAITRPAPIGLRQLHRQAADAAGGRVHHHALALARAWREVRNRCQAVSPWISSASAASSSRPSGTAEQSRGGRRRLLGVAARLEQAPPPARPPRSRRRASTVPATSPPSTNGSSTLGHVAGSRAGGCRRSSPPRARRRTSTSPSPRARARAPRPPPAPRARRTRRSGPRARRILAHGLPRGARR